jgi:hypothetical protein
LLFTVVSTGHVNVLNFRCELHIIR